MAIWPALRSRSTGRRCGDGIPWTSLVGRRDSAPCLAFAKSFISWYYPNCFYLTCFRNRSGCPRSTTTAIAIFPPRCLRAADSGRPAKLLSCPSVTPHNPASHRVATHPPASYMVARPCVCLAALPRRWTSAWHRRGPGLRARRRIIMWLLGLVFRRVLHRRIAMKKVNFRDTDMTFCSEGSMANAVA